MLNWIDNFLNRITMYRLMLYFLIVLLVAAVLFSALGKIPFGVNAILGSTLFLIAACWIFNTALSRLFRVPTNVESVYITALILALIITPVSTLSGFYFLLWASLLAMASKYLVARRRKHLFNPAALAVVITAFVLQQAAGWWVANNWLLPLVVVGGLLMVRKLRRFHLVMAFLVTAVVADMALGLLQGTAGSTVLQQFVLVLPTFFFAFVMLTEPLTTPPTKNLQMVYGGLVGVFFAPQWHIGNYYSLPEIALVIGNIFSYMVSPKAKWLLELKNKNQLAPTVTELVFQSDRPIDFQPGQYLEWTLPHRKPDSRGNRRYFTIASSPTETTIRLGSKFYDRPSTFKQTLQALPAGAKMLAGQLAGDFVLPEDQEQKLVFIAGGIGITPFRSMLQFLLDKKQRRPITLFYSNRSASDVVYQELLDQAVQKLGVKVVYTLTDPNVPADWPGRTGLVDTAMIEQEVPDYKQSMFYLSGPHAMVTAFEQTLKQMGLPAHQIKIDFFPGFV